MKFVSTQNLKQLAVIKTFNFFKYSKSFNLYFFLENFHYSSSYDVLSNTLVSFNKKKKLLNENHEKAHLGMSVPTIYKTFYHKFKLFIIQNNFFFSMNFEAMSFRFKMALNTISLSKNFSKKTYGRTLFIIKPRKNGFFVLSLGIFGLISFLDLSLLIKYQAYYYFSKFKNFLISYSNKNYLFLLRLLNRYIFITFYKTKKLKKNLRRLRFFRLKKQILLKKGKGCRYLIIFCVLTEEIFQKIQLQKLREENKIIADTPVIDPVNLVKKSLIKFLELNNSDV